MLVTSSSLVCKSFDRGTPGTVQLYVSLNAGADFHATGLTFVFYTQPVMVSQSVSQSEMQP